MDPGYPWWVTSHPNPASPPGIMTPKPLPDGSIAHAADGYSANFYTPRPVGAQFPVFAGEVAALAAKGLSPQAIATQLWISVSVVDGVLGTYGGG